ncbi:DUF4190 domain-containing protein [Isoptericola sp. NEAU-Y5]|uniref:DUF4190 domain-containing protein n=1 Tax=Isoptericola luteus TaxID=2879484 RepID=A0ABS7ZE42_9MICO|nr:DUF4190 domain-containing protein [Isoptericola sp. NEAU-Y5]MCA5893313.1 DUF4190 domain-containing protein [Isoptericola sp. NEAU-Y5]
MTTPDPTTPGAPHETGAAVAAPPAPYAGSGQPQADNPGKTLGIVGLVLGFLGPLSLVGLVLSIVGMVKSRKAGRSNGVALAGIIVSALVLLGTIVLSVVVGTLLGHVVETCGDLGPGEHYVDGVTYTCS